MAQLRLFGGNETPSIDAQFSSMERIVLEHGAWLDVAKGWLRGDAEIFTLLRDEVEWKSERRVMYEREVDVLRQVASLDASLHPIFGAMRVVLDARYRTEFERTSVALYRDGRDSVAWHGDHVAREMDEALVATISVGVPRKFSIRPRKRSKSSTAAG